MKIKVLATLGIVVVSTLTSSAAVSVTAATGGANISADKAANSPNAAWTTLGTITITEGVKSDIAAGTNKTLILKAPTGFQFNSGVAPVVAFTSKKDLSAASASITTNTITLTLTSKGVANSDSITIKSIQVRPLLGTPLATAGNIYRPSSTNGGTATITGITATSNTDGSGGTSFGALSETGGTARKLVFATSPGGAVMSNIFTIQPIIRTQDQFGNYSSNGLAATVSVITSLNSGAGSLLGTRTNNIGSSGGKGTLTHTNLLITATGTNFQLKAAATGFTNGLSSIFAVSGPTASVTWTNPAAIAYGTALSGVQLNATSAIPGSYVYSPVSGSVLASGTRSLGVLFTPTNTNYPPVNASVTINVTKVNLSVTASNATRPYGLTNPVFTGSIVGKVNSDNITANYTCSATVSSTNGSYPIIPSLVDPSNRATNYNVALTNGTLVVQAPAVPKLSALMLTNKHVMIELQGATNPVYTIQSRSSLANTWTNLGDAVVLSNKLVFDDSNNTTNKTRFYRAILK